MQYPLNYSGTRFLSAENKITQFPDAFRLKVCLTLVTAAQGKTCQPNIYLDIVKMHTCNCFTVIAFNKITYPPYVPLSYFNLLLLPILKRNREDRIGQDRRFLAETSGIFIRQKQPDKWLCFVGTDLDNGVTTQNLQWGTFTQDGALKNSMKSHGPFVRYEVFIRVTAGRSLDHSFTVYLFSLKGSLG